MNVFLCTVCDLHVFIKPGIEVSFWDIFQVKLPPFLNKWFFLMFSLLVVICQMGHGNLQNQWKEKMAIWWFQARLLLAMLEKSPRGQRHTPNFAKCLLCTLYMVNSWLFCSIKIEVIYRFNKYALTLFVKHCAWCGRVSGQANQQHLCFHGAYNLVMKTDSKWFQKWVIEKDEMLWKRIAAGSLRKFLWRLDIYKEI